MIISALLIFLFIELLFAIGTVFVLYHFYSFRVGRNHRILILIFIIGSIALFLAEFAFFAALDWGIVFDLIKSRIQTQ